MPTLANRGYTACLLWRLSKENFDHKLTYLREIEWEPLFVVLYDPFDKRTLLYRAQKLLKAMSNSIGLRSLLQTSTNRCMSNFVDFGSLSYPLRRQTGVENVAISAVDHYRGPEIVNKQSI
jgi:hypothetical protein